jgi:hypothetical protein
MVKMCTTVRDVNVVTTTEFSSLRQVWRDNARREGRFPPPRPDPGRDEIQRYVNARWIGSCEAAWRLFGFETFSKSHTVYRVPCHLPNRQTVGWNQSQQGAESALRRGARTMLTEFFQIAQREHAHATAAQGGDVDWQGIDGPRAYELTYSEMPLYYTWTTTGSHAFQWRRRIRRLSRTTVARMYTGTPACTYLHMLYLHLHLTPPPV